MWGRGIRGLNGNEKKKLSETNKTKVELGLVPRKEILYKLESMRTT